MALGGSVTNVLLVSGPRGTGRNALVKQLMKETVTTADGESCISIDYLINRIQFDYLVYRIAIKFARHIHDFTVTILNVFKKMINFTTRYKYDR